MSFIVLHVQVPEDLSDILKAELSELGFDAFLDHESGFEASVAKNQFLQEAVKEIIAQYNHTNQISWKAEEVEKQNWNKLWEDNFHPIEISKDCYIRAEFHPPVDGYKYQLIITPKMSFGTGHHATTSLMIQHQLLLDHQGKKVFDIGCGTGVLAIMAAKLGAEKVVACDIEDWSVENALENAVMNQVNIEAFEGVVEQVEGEEVYDIILANINLNVHKQSMAEYVRLLKFGGYLLLSGFYEADIPIIQNMADQLKMQKISQKIQLDWTSIVYRK
ncbi:MAG: 50S ribosomal protein L11 methyltransferase [Flammeovirgaceae bacterium]